MLTEPKKVYDAPPGHWEAIYINSEPIGISATVTPFQDSASEDKEKKYAPAVVDARNAMLKTSSGRMSKTLGEDTDHLKDEIDLEAYGKPE